MKCVLVLVKSSSLVEGLGFLTVLGYLIAITEKQADVSKIFW